MFNRAIELINQAKSIVIIQAENPDGDSLGSSLALYEILSDLGKNVSLHCPILMPKYLHYINGWDLVSEDLDTKADLAIIVDTDAEILLSKTLEIAGARHFLETKNVLVIDHHLTETNLTFDHQIIKQKVVSTSHVINNLCETAQWQINEVAAENMLIALMSDSRGLTVPDCDVESFRFATKMIEKGASNAVIEERRRQYMKKPADVLAYKGELLQRIEYFLDNKLALIHIPFADIQQYSDKYNPSVLVIDEMRLVDDVEVAIAIKTYPDKKLTGKIMVNTPIANEIAGFFGGGGHAYAAGFRVYDDYDVFLPELIEAVDKILRNFHQNETV